MDVSLTTESITFVNSKKEFIVLSNGYGSFLTIADATRIWASRPDFLFNISYRIAGFKEDFVSSLKTFFEEEGVNKIDEIIENSISGKNFTSVFASLYEEEYNEYIEWKKAAVKSNFTSDGAALFDIVSNLNPDMLQKPKEEKKKTTLRPKSPRVEAFVKRFKELPPGKLMDVSKLEESGKGATKRDPPKKGKMYYSPDLPMVSSDLDTYLLAISMLPGGADRYINAVNYVREHGPIAYTGNVPDISIIRSVEEEEEQKEEELNPDMYYAPKDEDQTLPQEGAKVYPIHDAKHYAKLRKEKAEKEAKEKEEKDAKEKIEKEAREAKEKIEKEVKDAKEKIEKEEKEAKEKIEKEEKEAKKKIEKEEKEAKKKIEKEEEKEEKEEEEKEGEEESYYKPRKNVFGKVDGENALIIPANQQKDDMFSFRAADSSIVLDNPKTMKKMLVPDLKKMASLLGISGYSKLKKDELLEKITPRIVFE
jgi:chemotaxis protein histidine kinase CheA